MKQDYTHVVMVIDRSGSMSSNWSDVLGGYKQIVQDNKKDSGQCTFTVAVFDDRYDVIFLTASSLSFPKKASKNFLYFDILIYYI